MKIDRIQISYHDDDDDSHTEDFYHENIEDFFPFLLEIGYADDIQITKRYNLSEDVMKRLKGGKRK